MAETWYCTNSAGAACGPGDQEALATSDNGSLATKALDGTGDTWNRTETARTIQAGTWTVSFAVQTGTGGGPTNRVNVLVQRRNSGCGIQQIIINEDVDTTKGATETLSTSGASPGAVTFASGDILTVIFTDANGNQTKTLRYDNSPTVNQYSYLTHPDEDVGGARRVMVIS